MIADGYADIFKAEALVGQLAFLLLVLGVLSQRYSRARAMIATGAFIGLVHSLIISRNDLAAFWWGLLLLASLAVLARRVFENSKTRFTAEEEAMLAGSSRPSRAAARVTCWIRASGYRAARAMC